MTEEQEQLRPLEILFKQRKQSFEFWFPRLDLFFSVYKIQQPEF